MDIATSFASQAVLQANASSFTVPIMRAFSTVVLLGSFAFQSALGRPDAAAAVAQTRRHVPTAEAFLAGEGPIALRHVLCNIGADGCDAAGAGPGVVIASPSKADPDYFYTWTRDSAMTFKAIVDTFISGHDQGLKAEIEKYVAAQATVQQVTNPSGSLADGSGLGEPKFYVNLTQFTGQWGRPQRDGPALRAIALMAYSNWLLGNGQQEEASKVVWPIIQNDLAYVAQYWNETGFDLWEEVKGSSFFTLANQHRALVEGIALASKLGSSCPGCDQVAPQVLCFLQSFWSSSKGYVVANVNGENGRSGKDANTILGSLSTFDPAAGCDTATFQPCSDKALANHKAVVDSFRSIYPINADIAKGKAVAIGRYAEDTYQGGNPWFLNTLAAAEQLYDALHVFQVQGQITVTSTSLPFFQDIVPSVMVGTFPAGSSNYKLLCDALEAYADGFVQVVAAHAPDDGSLSEQFSKLNGSSLSARDLTWSYASVLTVAARRAGIMPATWGAASANSFPGTCATTSVVGSYHVPTSSGSGPPTPCGVAVTFNELVKTIYGQTIKIVGDIAALGNWDVSHAVPLNAVDYTADNPLWHVTVSLPAGQDVHYKFINVQPDGHVVWESGPGHVYHVDTKCGASQTVSEYWHH